jgi:hypothetical protein
MACTSERGSILSSLGDETGSDGDDAGGLVGYGERAPSIA